MVIIYRADIYYDWEDLEDNQVIADALFRCGKPTTPLQCGLVLADIAFQLGVPTDCVKARMDEIDLRQLGYYGLDGISIQWDDEVISERLDRSILDACNGIDTCTYELGDSDNPCGLYGKINLKGCTICIYEKRLRDILMNPFLQGSTGIVNYENKLKIFDIFA